MHKYLIALLLFSGVFVRHGQAKETDTETDAIGPAFISLFPKYSIGLEGGVTLPFTDVSDGKPAAVAGITAGIRPVPALQLLLNLQLGQLKGGEEVASFMWFKNRYYYGSATARFYPLALLQNQKGIVYLGNIYVGTGLAVVKSDASSNEFFHPEAGAIKGGYKGTSILLPVEFGLNVPLVQWSSKGQALYLNANCRHHFGFKDKLDAYEPSVMASGKNDVYSQLTLGLSFQF